ncbi:MAG: UDP-glucose 4-epimerase [Micromonosporaceae bacterium]|nr:UDP-glucose 4-epimerase [Micromonosporaceae bacterium]
MKVLVTGGLGYIGWAVTKALLQAGHDVDVLTRQSDAVPPAGASLVRADLTDANGVADVATAGKYTGVCHLAALTRGRDSFADPLNYWNVNVGGTLNLLRALVQVQSQPTRFVFASTNIVYGSQRDGALSEDLQPRPESPYSASKAAAERLVSDLAGTGAITAIVLRVFNASGAVDHRPDRDPTRIIPNIMRAARGELPALTVNGDGTARRDFTHVGDVATAFRLALEADRQGTAIYNVGTGHGTSVAELIAAAEKITGRQIPIERLPPKPEPHTSVADPTHIQTELGWRPVNSDLTTILSSAWEAINCHDYGCGLG